MKKTGVLAVFLILLFNLVIAQDESQEIVSGNELLVRFHTGVMNFPILMYT